MDNKLFVFLLTADTEWLGRHKDKLHESYDLNVFQGAPECQAALQDHQPNILIIDTRVPGAAELSQATRDDFMTSDVFQLLWQDPATLGEGEHVADDFLPLPLSDAMFWAKMAVLKKQFAAKAVVREQLGYAQNVALTAMCSMGELGNIMQFLSKSFVCKNVQGVAELAVETLKQYELGGVVQFRWEGDNHVASTVGTPPTQEEMDVIDQMRTLGRLFELKEKMIVNYDHTSVLISNMPEDADKAGRVRDNIATLAEGMESRIQALLLENDNLLKQQGIRYAVGEIRDTVKGLHAGQLSDLERARGAVNEVINEFEDAFMHMGMLPEVENQLISQLVDLRHRVSDIVGQRGEVDTKLRAVVDSLEALAGEVGVNPNPEG